ncbi:TRAP transporter substrate-binding protein [Bosea sp. (in: a-proteobacteria)]|uniref:TRAP transporter substrate-binding protein n=1 Tax=Bosea sp. (in: a-proteobacteria) TaxID=1871050 RepID=UPI002FC87928
MGISRRQFLAGGSATVFAGLSAGRVRAAEFTYKLANDLPPDDPMNVRFTAALRAIEQDSNGRMQIRLFPSSQLGTITEELNQVRNGALEFYCCGYGNQMPVAPLAGINSLAFAWTDYDKIWPAMDGELGAFLAAEVAKVGTIQHIGKAFNVGFRQITSGSRVIREPGDLKGFKIRVPPAPILASLFSALGASPTSLSFGELYPALQTGLVDGSDNPLWTLNSMRIHEVQKNITITNHSWDAFIPVANRRAWNRLPADIREIVAKRFAEAALGQREDIAKAEANAEKALSGNGVAIHRPTPGLFREALGKTAYYKDWREKIGPQGWAVLQKTAGV